MAGKFKPMSQIKQLFLMHQQGMAIKAIARQLGMSKNTVKAYLARINNSECGMDGILTMEEPVLENKLFSGTPSYKEKRYEHIKNKLGYYVSELEKKGVTRKLLWQEYRNDFPGGYGYTQFCYHIEQYQLAQNPTMVLQHEAGDKLFIDFAGKKLSYIDKETGEIIECEVFIACLPYSDYGFAMATKSQRTEDLVYALSSCLKELGGVPRSLVPDNMKSAVYKTNRYEPDINRVLEDFGNHYGMAIIPARARKPKDKALVENQVKLIYNRVYAKLRNQQFFDITSLNNAIKEKIKEHNQTRMVQKDYCREEKFLSDEKHALKPLPIEEFEIKYYKELKVAKNNHVYLSCDKHYYSVPYAYTGSKVKVIYTRSLVSIYAQGKKIAAHVRNYRQGGYTTHKEHLCSHHKHYLDRSPEYYLKKAGMTSEVFFQFVENLFNQNKHPEQIYRTCDGLLSLQRKTGNNDFEKACQIALDTKNYSYAFIRNILDNKMLMNTHENCTKPLPIHSNTRGAAYFR